MEKTTKQAVRRPTTWACEFMSVFQIWLVVLENRLLEHNNLSLKVLATGQAKRKEEIEQLRSGTNSNLIPLKII